MKQILFPRQRINANSLPEVVKEKWPQDLLVEGFLPLPKRVLRGLAALYPGNEALEELLVILSDADFRRPRLLRQPSIGYLAFNVGLPAQRFTAALQRLVSKGWIRKEGTDDFLDLKRERLFELIREAAPEGT